MRPTHSGAVSEQDVYELLQNDRRRHVLEYLCREGRPTSISDLADVVAHTEADDPPPSQGLRESVYNSLRQTHLPKLHEQEVVTFDPNGRTVTPDSGLRHVDRYMGVHAPGGITWLGYYRGLALGVNLVLLGVFLEAPLLAAAPPLLLVSIALGLIALSTTYQLWSRRRLYYREFVR